MVPDIGRGSRTHGLLVYLYGPGRREEHTDAHLVGSWDGFAPDPGRDTGLDPDPKVTLARLTAALDLRVKQAGDRAPAKHVWHCSVRTAPGDRRLDDEEWNAVAQRIVHATGIAPAGDPDGCRWIAVRHAEDHIHIVATLVRGDLRNPRLNYDFNKAQAECRHIEKEMGLRRLNAGDGTAAKNPSSAEKFKAERTGRPETSRETLREAVRRAVAGADSEEEFFTRLREAGVRVKLRHAPSGDALGYNVALPGDRNRDGAPVWYPGSKLAPDLSLPKIRLRLTDGAAEPSAPAVGADRTNWSPPARQRRNATVIAERSATLLERDEDGEAAPSSSASENSSTQWPRPHRPPPAPSWPPQLAPSNGQPAVMSAPNAPTPGPSARPPEALSRPAGRSAEARTAAPPPCSSPPSSWSPSPPPAGTPPADTPSRPTPPDKPPRTYAPPTARPPPPRCACCTTKAAPFLTPSASCTRPPFAPSCPRRSYGQEARKRGPTPWSPPSPRQSGQAMTPKPSCARPSTCANSTAPTT